MNDDDPSADQDVVLRVRIAKLRQEHQDLDAAVHALELSQHLDQIQIMRLKKKKLILRDQIARAARRHGNNQRNGPLRIFGPGWIRKSRDPDSESQPDPETHERLADPDRLAGLPAPQPPRHAAESGVAPG